MKFAIVLAAFVACASASAVWPYGYASNYLSAPITQYSTVNAQYVPAVVVRTPTVYAAQRSYGYGSDDGSWDEARYGDRGAYNSWNNGYGYQAVAYAPVQHSASYTAKTRGALHSAPLEGHAVSQTSLNLAPAPGTY